MDDPGSKHLTAQQIQWFKTLRERLEPETGRSLEDWIAIARTCPETGHRAKLRWFKQSWGLLQNRASYVLSQADPGGPSWTEPASLRHSLWVGERSRDILVRVEKKALSLQSVVAGQRKSFTAWSRRSQFAAIRPRGQTGAMLGLAVATDAAVGLLSRQNERWSERLKSKIELSTPDDVTPDVERLIEAAWIAS